MHIRLMSHVEHEPVHPRVKHLVDGERQLDYAEVRGKMAARAGHAFDQEFSDLTAQRRILVRRERGEVGMAVDFL